MLKVTLPILYITEQDVETFTEDPREYINQQYDFLESSLSAKAQAADLLDDLCKYSSDVKKVRKAGKTVRKRGKPDYLHTFIQFVAQHLTEFEAATLGGQQPDWRIKEALMTAVCCIAVSDLLWNNKFNLKDDMEKLLANYILPELKSDIP